MFDKVNVIIGTFSSKCSTRPKRKTPTRCKNKPYYMICNEDGEPKSSRLFASPCKDHLHIAIRNAWKDNLRLKKLSDKNRKNFLKEELKKLSNRRVK